MFGMEVEMARGKSSTGMECDDRMQYILEAEWPGASPNSSGVLCIVCNSSNNCAKHAQSLGA